VHDRWVNFKELRRFCGTAVSTVLFVPSARYHLRSLFTAMTLRHPRSGDARLGHQAQSNLLWWMDLVATSAEDFPIWPGSATVQMDTDASGLARGAALGDMIEARSYHGRLRSGLHINVLELGAVTLALRSFRHLIPRGTVLRPRTDSMVALGEIHAQSSRSLVLLDDYRALQELCRKMDVQMRAEHVSSALNDWADRLSREHDSAGWTLATEAVDTFNREFGPHSVDLFPSELNTRCRKFYSRRPCPSAAGVNAPTQSWVGENAWANPPFHLVGAVVARILAARATVTLIAPAWPAQLLWPLAMAGAASMRLLPPACGVFIHGSSSQLARTLSWRIAVFRFAPTAPSAMTSSASGSSFLAWYRRLSTTRTPSGSSRADAARLPSQYTPLLHEQVALLSSLLCGTRACPPPCRACRCGRIHPLGAAAARSLPPVVAEVPVCRRVHPLRGRP